MDPRFQQAAECGNIDELYALINENPYILETFDGVPFINTPLHVTAAFGNLPFAEEMLNLKPSFARKLNTSGYSPMHLAVDNDQENYILRMLYLDHDLARIKGRNGITPFLSLVEKGKVGLVTECLFRSPECIKDVSVDGQNALHLAVLNDRFEVLQVLTGWIQKMSQKDAASIEINVLNYMDHNYDTALHLAAYNNDHQAVRLLLECRSVQRNKVNGDGLTFLDILRYQDQNASGELGIEGQGAAGGDLDLEQVVLKTGCKEASSVPKSKEGSDILKSPINFWTNCFMVMRRLRSSTSEEARGVFLIVCTLIITATYQTALQPPGGVHQSEDANANAGSVVMKNAFYSLLWLSNTLGFCCALFYTFCLIPLDSLFTSWFGWIGGSLCVSYALAMAVISPHTLVFLFATFVFFLLFAFYLLLEVFLGHWRKHQTMTPKPRLSWFWKV